MSGIYGYSASKQMPEGLHRLGIWNRPYGKEGHEDVALTMGGLGCCQQHFSNTFPGSTPVLRREGKLAVIDALLYKREELIPLVGSPENISDEDLLLDLVLTKGFDALAQINGDFAGAVYDEKEHSWILFRDHSGVRPLFYYAMGDLFAFSTDLRGLAALPGVDLSVNEEKLYLRMMGYNDLTLCETEYAHIRCIHPASWTLIRQGNGGFHKEEHIYWKWRQNKIRLKDDRAYQQELRRLITDAVARRLAACPGVVGCELSGGLDSSVIAILISRLGREGRFFSWSFSEDDIPMQERDERKIIQDICQQENIQCDFAKIKLDGKLEDVFQKVDPPYLNTRFISEGSKLLSQQGVRVMFTGHGGDEGVSHRCNFFELWYHREYWAFFRNIYRGTRGKKFRLLRTVKRSLRQIFKANPYFLAPYHNTYSNASRLVNPEFIKRMEGKAKPLSLPFAYNPKEYILQGGHRVRLDNVAVQGAENGVQYMIPFVDYRVLDFALSIPRSQFHNGYNNRYIYREAFHDMIPQSLRDMHYKDTPSQETYMPDLDLYQVFLRDRDSVVNHLDPEEWKDYLDLDILKIIEIPRNYTREDYIRASAILNQATLCAVIQHVKKNASVWSENCGENLSV